MTSGVEKIFFDLGFTEVNKYSINPASDVPKLKKGWSMPGYAGQATHNLWVVNHILSKFITSAAFDLGDIGRFKATSATLGQKSGRWNIGCFTLNIGHYGPNIGRFGSTSAALPSATFHQTSATFHQTSATFNRTHLHGLVDGFSFALLVYSISTMIWSSNFEPRY